GLEFIHSCRQIHRDIKPSNLLINHTGAVKVSDFGLMKEVDSTDAMASTFVGTMNYMSPERLGGEEYTTTSDIWSFGLSIMAVAMGRFPIEFTGKRNSSEPVAGARPNDPCAISLCHCCRRLLGAADKIDGGATTHPAGGRVFRGIP
ncbi:MKK6, partial [Symbiodinium sp. KB8]